MNATEYQQAKVRGASRAVEAAVESIGYMGIALADGNVSQARDLNRQANDETQRARRYLLAAGIAETPLAAGVATPISIFQLDTPDTRELLDLLQRAQAVADRVDIARGRALTPLRGGPVDPSAPLLPGESHGTDLAEAISEIALRLRVEVFGPKGRE